MQPVFTTPVHAPHTCVRYPSAVFLFIHTNYCFKHKKYHSMIVSLYDYESRFGLDVTMPLIYWMFCHILNFQEISLDDVRFFAYPFKSASMN